MNIPGYIDLQVNGCLGVDFSAPDLTDTDFARACHAVLADGVAGFLPTLVTSPVTVYERNLPIMASVMRGPELEGRVLGIHIEGPFLSSESGYVGAHNPLHVIPPDVALLERLQPLAGGAVRMLTLAAELPGAAELARRAVELGMVVSIGHSHCDAVALAELAEAGATCLTHLGNGLPATLPRHPNALWAALAEDRLMGSVIADGHHLDPAALKSIIRAKGVARAFVVSDLCPFAGLAPGEYTWCGRRIALDETGSVRDAERDNLAGSGVGMAKAMEHLASLDFLSEADLIALGYDNPLRLLGISPAPRSR